MKKVVLGPFKEKIKVSASQHIVYSYPAESLHSASKACLSSPYVWDLNLIIMSAVPVALIQ